MLIHLRLVNLKQRWVLGTRHIQSEVAYMRQRYTSNISSSPHREQHMQPFLSDRLSRVGDGNNE